MLSTIIRDFGITEYKKLSLNLQKVTNALEEMKKRDVLLAYKTEKIFEGTGKSKLLDAKFTLTPSLSFVSETKHRNARRTKLKQILAAESESNQPSTI